MRQVVSAEDFPGPTCEPQYHVSKKAELFSTEINPTEIHDKVSNQLKLYYISISKAQQMLTILRKIKYLIVRKHVEAVPN